MDIRERLQLLEKLPRNKGVASRSVPVSENSPFSLSDFISGGTVTNSFGSYFYIEREYPAEYIHGSIQIKDLLRLSPKLLALLDNQPDLASIKLEKSLFIDTETTGLSGGAGTCAFLVGVGFFEDEKFKVAQFFMSDFNEEGAMLHDLELLFNKFELLISYNGKSFDIPLLNSRNIYQGIKSVFSRMHHFDLLHSVRRLWSHRLPDCSLSSSESGLIEKKRINDIPGHLIPYTYFQFLKNKDPRPLKPILYHNELDIVSMVAILALGLTTLDKPRLYCKTPEDALKVGKIFEKALDLKSARLLYEDALKNSTGGKGRFDLLMRTSFVHKRQQGWPEAAALWQEAADLFFDPLPCIELAKYYEHRTRDLEQALAVVEKALAELEIMSAMNRKSEWKIHEEDLQYRHKRLLRKIRTSLPSEDSEIASE